MDAVETFDFFVMMIFTFLIIGFILIPLNAFKEYKKERKADDRTAEKLKHMIKDKFFPHRPIDVYFKGKRGTTFMFNVKVLNDERNSAIGYYDFEVWKIEGFDEWEFINLRIT